VACGRVAERKARGPGKRPETFTFLGLTHDGTRHHPGHFKGGGKTDKTRLRRRLATFHQRLQRMRHDPLHAQVAPLNHARRGHSAYDGVAGNWRSLQRLDANVERYWRPMLSRRRRTGMSRWDVFPPIQSAYPLPRPKRFLPSTRITSYAVLSSRV
jgi:RNA-directed DNA polymerase